MHGWLFEDIHVAKPEALIILVNDPRKLNNAINTCQVNPKIIFYYAFSLNIYEYW